MEDDVVFDMEIGQGTEFCSEMEESEDESQVASKQKGKRKKENVNQNAVVDLKRKEGMEDGEISNNDDLIIKLKKLRKKL